MDELEKVIKDAINEDNKIVYPQGKLPLSETIAQAVREHLEKEEAVCVRCFKPYHRVCPPCHDAILQIRRQQGE